MEISREFIEKLILESVTIYNGFLDEHEKKLPCIDLTEENGVDYNDFGAIISLTFNRLYDLGIELNIDKYSEELLERRNVKELSKYLIEVIGMVS